VSVEQRLQRLEDEAAICRVTADYAAMVNWGWNGVQVDRDGLRRVLAIDIHWKADAMKVDVRGVDALLEVIGQPQPGVDIAMHSFTNPRIEVNGDTASGNWLLWVAVRSNGKTDQVFQSEDIQYVRADDGWRISGIDLHFGTTMNMNA
jgi:hypothetical protein